MNKMRAVLCTKYGGPDVLKVGEVQKPVPKDDEVLVKIYATAVTASDGVIRGLEVPGGYRFPLKQIVRFAMRLVIGFNKPRNPIIGLVFSGEIEATGTKIKSFKIGDEVFGFTGMSRGTYAEYKCVSAKEIASGEVFLKPKNANHSELAAIVYGGVLATHFMKDMNIKENDKVLIYGASGATGTIAIQLAKKYKAEVTAVSSEKNFELSAMLGADKFINYSDSNMFYQLEKYDFILDAVGKNKSSYLKTLCEKSLLPKGKYVSVDDEFIKVQPNYLPKIKELIETNSLLAVIDKEYPLENIVEAHRYVDKGHKVGNVVIQIQDPSKDFLLEI